MNLEKLAQQILSMPIGGDELALLKTRYFDAARALNKKYKWLVFQKIFILILQYGFIFCLCMIATTKALLEYIGVKLSPTAEIIVNIVLFTLFYIFTFGACVALLVDYIVGITKSIYDTTKKIDAYMGEGWKFVSGAGKYDTPNMAERVASLINKLGKIDFEKYVTPPSQDTEIIGEAPQINIVTATPKEEPLATPRNMLRRTRSYSTLQVPSASQLVRKMGSGTDNTFYNIDISTDIPDIDTFTDIV